MSHDSPPTAEQIYSADYKVAVCIAEGIVNDFCDAQDVVQQAGVALGNWKPKEPGGKVSANLFFKIVTGDALDALRSKIRRAKHEVRGSDFDAPNDDGKLVPFLSTLPDEKSPQQPEQSALMSALLDKMHRWLGRVYPDGAEVFRIHKLEDRSQAETARILGVNENTVKQRWKKACTMLRTHFRKAYDELFN